MNIEQAKTADYSYFDGELRPDDHRIVHERGRLHDIRLTDDEMDQAMHIRHEIHAMVDHAAHQAQIGEYLAARLNRVHAEQTVLLAHVRERECLRVLDITLDEDFKIVEAQP